MTSCYCRLGGLYAAWSIGPQVDVTLHRIRMTQRPDDEGRCLGVVNTDSSVVERYDVYRSVCSGTSWCLVLK